MSGEEELVKLLSSLIQIDTSNPPGNESRAADFLRDWLWERGVRSEIIEYEKGRGNLVSRIRGSGEGPSLLLLSHMDVVPAEPSRWKIPPFSGTVKDGYVWGRGALDMKSMLAVEAMIFSETADRRLRGDLVLAATADEERGGSGMEMLLRNNREMVMADYVINEGGGEGILTRSGWLFDIQTGERGVFWFRVYTRGLPAHGSVPGLGINAIDKMRMVLNRISDFRGIIEKETPSWKYVEALLTMEGLLAGRLDDTNLDELLNRLSEEDRGLAECIRSMLTVTMTPTMIHGGVKENVVPYECELTVDCRVPPGYSRDSVRKIVESILLGLDCESKFIQEAEPTISPVGTPLYAALEKSLLENLPGTRLEPSTKVGGTDSRYFRRLGIAAYGFQPMKVEGSYVEWSRMIHGDNERISVENLIFSYRVLKRAIEYLMLE
ncbi:MAG: M20/M25/M40 family metallo-hydrolase [Thermoproteota archaeon]